jgi:dienelactone hydrolase
VNEQTIWPLDAYGALRYLRSRTDVIKDRIGVQGWSKGGMTVLVTISDRAPGRPTASTESGFRAAIAEYPGCGMEAIQGAYCTYAPVLMMIAGADEEVSPQRCGAFAKQARQNGNPLQFTIYLGASHNFDDPSKCKQSIAANHDATQDAMRRAESFFAANLSMGAHSAGHGG